MATAVENSSGASSEPSFGALGTLDSHMAMERRVSISTLPLDTEAQRETAVLRMLSEAGISYTVHRHEAVQTVQEQASAVEVMLLQEEEKKGH